MLRFRMNFLWWKLLTFVQSLAFLIFDENEYSL